MDAVTFLSLVLPKAGYPCIVTPTPNGGKGFWHHPTNSIKTAAKIAMREHAQGRDVFFAVGTLKELHVEDPATGKKSWRTADNISHWRCWIADLDIGDSPKKYPNQAQAINHIVKFCTETGLPVPMLVSSGYGVHAYWLSDSDIPATVWQSVAIKFKALLGAYGVLADTSRTSDVASILRVVGTSNFKRGQATEVKILSEATPAIQPLQFLKLVEDASKQFNVAPPAATPKSKDTGLGSFETQTEPAHLLPIAKQCEQIKQMVLTKGNLPENQWYKGLQLVRFCQYSGVEGPALAQHLSSGHPGYSEQETAERLIRLEDYGPTLCSSFMDVNPEGCSDCPHKGRIRSPIVLGIKVAEAQAPTMEIQHRDGRIDQIEIPNPPLPWVRTSGGKLGRKSKDPATGTDYTEIFYDYDIHPTKRLLDESTMTEIFYFRSWLPKDGWREYPIPASMMYDSRSLFTTMADRGVMPDLKSKDMLTQYMLAYMKKLQTAAPAESIYSQMGWKKDNSEFIVGDVSYKNDNTSSRIKLVEGYTPVIDNFEAKGSLDKWKEILDIYKSPGHEDFALAIMAGFGAPMFHFTGFEGGVFSLNGTSGAGKSTILSVIHSIYGKPTCNVLLKKDTGNSKAVILSVYNNLPITLDEITTISPEEASQLIFDVTDGRDKKRLNADATLKASVRTWGLILFTTTNRSLPQMVLANKPEASGEMMRILERRVEALDQMKYAEARKKFEPLKDNYGLAGQFLIPWYVENLDEAIRLLNGFVDRLSDKVNAQVPERFWLSMCGTALLGCHVGSLLELHNFKIEDVFDQCCKVILESRETTASQTKNSVDILTDFLNYSLGQTLVVRESSKSDIPEISVRPRGELTVRSELVSKRIYIDCSALIRYCADRAHDIGQTKKELRNNKVLLRDNASKALGEGTEYIGGKTKVWVIDAAHSLMSGVPALALHGKGDTAKEATA